MLKNILLDIDDTLLDFRVAERRAVSRTLSDMGVTPTDEILDRYSIVNLAQWKRLERGEISRQEVKEGRYRILYEEFGIDGVSPLETTLLYEKHLACGHIFIDGAQKLLDDLYPKYNLYLVSNGTLSVQRGRIASANIAGYFKGIFISEEIGADKPYKQFFDKCFSEIKDFKREETAIVGDSLTSDVLGGKNAGITAIWFNPHGENAENILPDYEIRTLSELPKLIESIR